MDKCVCVWCIYLHVCTHVYTCGLMSSVFFAFAHVCDTSMPFKLRVIYTITRAKRVDITIQTYLIIDGFDGHFSYGFSADQCQ